MGTISLLLLMRILYFSRVFWRTLKALLFPWLCMSTLHFHKCCMSAIEFSLNVCKFHFILSLYLGEIGLTVSFTPMMWYEIVLFWNTSGQLAVIWITKPTLFDFRLLCRYIIACQCLQLTLKHCFWTWYTYFKALFGPSYDPLQLNDYWISS